MSKTFKQVLDEICYDCCHAHCEYCTAKEILLRILGKDPRNIIQIKCIEKYKYDRSKQLDHDIEWTQATKEWINFGYAERFADVYDVDLHFNVIYCRTVPQLP